jgi:ketoreductase RED2
VQADIADKEQGQRLLDATIERFGRLDILVNNAGWTTVVPHHDLDALTDEIFRKTFEVNVFGTWWLTKAAMPLLRQSDDGHVVNITSIAGVRPVGSSIAYSMTKAALNQMTLLLAEVVRPGAGERGGARPRGHAVDGRLGRPARRWPASPR